MRILLFLFTVTIFMRCDVDNTRDLDPVRALAPTYTTIDNGESLLENPREIISPTDVIVRLDQLLIFEPYYGVHLVDNSDVEAPTNTGFIRLPGATSFHVSENLLIAKLANHILVVNLDEEDLGKVISITANEESFLGIGQFPFDETYVGKFECVDLSNGIVSNWEFKSVIDPKCLAQ